LNTWLTNLVAIPPTPTMTTNVPFARVRSILSSMTTQDRTKLKKLIPKDAHKVPEDLSASTKYPSIMISVLPEGEGYGLLGHIAEHMLRMPAAACNIDSLLFVTREYYSDLSEADETRIRRSKTIPPFLEALKDTRRQLKVLFGDSEAEFEPEIQVGSVQGHPDIVCFGSSGSGATAPTATGGAGSKAATKTQVFEVKLAGQPTKDWLSYVFQVFSYAALIPATSIIHLVFPLHKHIWSYDVSAWAGRTAYLALLQGTATNMLTVAGPALVQSEALQEKYLIGSHVEKRGSLAKTLVELDPRKPWQVFLGNPISTRISVKDADLALAQKWIASHNARIYIHAPYLINLSSTEEYNITCLQDCLNAGITAGCKGVVVHVGKAGKMAVEDAIENMRNLLTEAIETATADCPILLETPAGQGSETLTTYEDFIGFVQSFNDTRLRICIDICHIFSCGWDPNAYLSRCLKEAPELLHLIHFNDSATECGSCLDRHAAIGTGHIGFEKLAAIAAVAAEAGIPCLME
jgi:deoxyribonuclease-4